MEQEKIIGFNEYCQQYIAEHIHDYTDRTHYMCDLGNTLTEGPNCDGTLTYWTKKAIEYLGEWFYEAGQYWQYEKDNFGEVYHNPFENPEAYMVCMVIEGVNDIISQCSFIWENWNEEVELTDEIADQICKEIFENNYQVRWAK